MFQDIQKKPGVTQIFHAQEMKSAKYGLDQPHQFENIEQIELYNDGNDKFKYLSQHNHKLKHLHIIFVSLLPSLKLIANIKTLEQLNIRVQQNQINQVLETIAQLNNLKRLEIRCNPLSNTRIIKQGTYKFDPQPIRSLNLEEFRLKVESLRNKTKIQLINFESLLQVEKLKKVVLYGLIINDQFETNQQEKVWFKNSNIESISIEQCIVHESFPIFLNKLPKYRKYYIDLLQEAQQHIVKTPKILLRQLPYLQFSSFDSIQVTDNTTIYTLFAQLKQLYSQLTFTSFQSKINDQKYLNNQNINKQQLIIPIYRIGLPVSKIWKQYIWNKSNLIQLDLNYSTVGNKIVIQIIKQNKQLTKLHLSESQINNTSASYIRQLRQLKSLELKGNLIDCELIKTILRNLKKLEKLLVEINTYGDKNILPIKNFDVDKLDSIVTYNVYEFPDKYKTKKELEKVVRRGRIN